VLNRPMPAVNWSMRDHDPVRHELLRLRYHLNAKGRARFTETVVTEVVGRFGGSEPAYICAFLALELFSATGQVPFVYFQF